MTKHWLAITAAGVAVVIPLAGFGGMTLMAFALASAAAAGTQCTSGQPVNATVAGNAAAAAPREALQPAQAANASVIVRVGRELGVSDQGITIALMTGLQESGLRNYANSGVPDSMSFPHDAFGHDHDSVDVFQQRPSAGWGNVAELMTPDYAARAFYGGPSGPNHGSPRGLLDIPGWESLTPGAAAQAVQVSAFPDAYSSHQASAQRILQQVGGSTQCPATSRHVAGDDYPWPNQLSYDNDGGLSPLGYYYRECVDFVAWRLNRDAGSTTAPWKWTWSTLTLHGGDAIAWIDSWRAAGWGVSKTPQAGGVAWWGTSVGSAGHVAYVQAVTPSGQVVLEEYNWGRTHRYNTRIVEASSVGMFLAPPP